MGYRIEYSRDIVIKKSVKSLKRRINSIMLWITALLMVIMMLWPVGWRCVRDLLLPGDKEVTAAALNGLVEDLSDGQPIGEAVEAFCREIIAGEE